MTYREQIIMHIKQQAKQPNRIALLCANIGNIFIKLVRTFYKNKIA